jgi:hypothetical protein
MVTLSVAGDSPSPDSMFYSEYLAKQWDMHGRYGGFCCAD